MVATKRHRSGLLVLAAAATMAFVATFAVLTLVNSGSGPAPERQLDGAAPARTTDGQIRQLQAQVREAPTQRRPVGRAGRDLPAEGARDRRRVLLHARRRRPAPGARARARRASRAWSAPAPSRSPATTSSAASATGSPPTASPPASPARSASSSTPQVELGRYGAAARTLQRMVDLKPNLASYARVSYLRELHGDLRRRALRDAPGGLRRRRRARERRLRPDAARQPRSSRPATCAPPGPPTSRRSRASRATCRPAPGWPRSTRPRRRWEPAIRRLRDAVARLPLPEYVVAARRDRAGGRARRRRAARPARWSAPRRGCCGPAASTPTSTWPCSRPTTAARPAASRSRGARGPQAPSVRSADALGWALTRAGQPRRPACRWARRALRLGSVDPTFLYHAGMAARAAGRTALARAWLRRALAHNPRFSPLVRAAGAARRCGEARASCVARPRAARCWCRRRPPAPTRSATSPSTTCRRCGSPATASTSRYTLDQAEIPTFQERDLPRATVLARKRREVARALHVTVDGRPSRSCRARGGSRRRRARAACRSRAWSCR